MQILELRLVVNKMKEFLNMIRDKNERRKTITI